MTSLSVYMMVLLAVTLHTGMGS